jgi:hypothetical protein
VREVILTVYRPLCVKEGTWKCAFAFGTAPSDPVRYGVGADFIEALLDALAMARSTYETLVPAGWEPESVGLVGVEYLPHRIGREYFIVLSKSAGATES